MKTLELKDRKRTTETARTVVIDFIKSFDFDSYTDITTIESKVFNIWFDKNGHGKMQDKAYFAIRECGFCIVSYLEECEGYGIYRHDYEHEWTDIEQVFDKTCTFINFKQLISSIEDFINKINLAVEAKENEIADFVAFAEGWKSYQLTGRVADEVEKNSEFI